MNKNKILLISLKFFKAILMLADVTVSEAGVKGFVTTKQKLRY